MLCGMQQCAALLLKNGLSSVTPLMQRAALSTKPGQV